VTFSAPNSPSLLAGDEEESPMSDFLTLDSLLIVLDDTSIGPK
jgi:hypothetical protein